MLSLYNRPAVAPVIGLSYSDFKSFQFQPEYFLFSAYADEAQINPIPLKATPWLLQIEWTAKSETPITIFRVQFMVRLRRSHY